MLSSALLKSLQAHNTSKCMVSPRQSVGAPFQHFFAAILNSLKPILESTRADRFPKTAEGPSAILWPSNISLSALHHVIVALDFDGRCYTWGRNDKGQLGHRDLIQRDIPTRVLGLSNYRIVKVGGGRQHTVVVIDDGISFAFGWNKNGQLGSGSTRNEVESSPVRCLVSDATNAVCGADFTVWLSSVQSSTILTVGLPQYGQLGHGTNNEYNAKEGTVKLAYEAQPHPRSIAALSAKTITKVACGNNHTVAVDSDGFVYTWEFGGYGRLGHREQKDEWTPRISWYQRQGYIKAMANLIEKEL